MIGFLFLGEEILNLIGIDINSFAVAGAFIIFFMAIEMVLGINLYKDDAPETASIVPLAFPMIAGAGTMTSLLSLRAEFDVINIIIAIIVNIIIVYAILKSSKKNRIYFRGFWNQYHSQNFWSNSIGYFSKAFHY